MWSSDPNDRSAIPARDFEEAKARASARRHALRGGATEMSDGTRRVLAWLFTALAAAAMVYAVATTFGDVAAIAFTAFLVVAIVTLRWLWR